MRLVVLLCCCSLMVVACDADKGLITKGISHIVAASEKPKDCEFLGKVNGASLLEKASGTVANYRASLKDIKRSVSSVGGNYLYIEKVVRDGALISGQAFHCDN